MEEGFEGKIYRPTRPVCLCCGWEVVTRTKEELPSTRYRGRDGWMEEATRGRWRGEGDALAQLESLHLLSREGAVPKPSLLPRAPAYLSMYTAQITMNEAPAYAFLNGPRDG